MQIAGLFAGIGGFERGLGRAGHTTNLLCEIDRGARAVLDERFPNAEKHDDVCTLKGLPAGTELLTAGFPCQDLSQAGRTAGIGGSRSGLVGEVFRLLKKSRVPYVLIENVPFMLQLAKGRALEFIVDSLEGLGYKWAYRVVDTRAFGLPQRRLRVFLLATREADPREVLFADDAGLPPAQPKYDPAYAHGFYWTEGTRGLGWAFDAVPTLKGGSSVGIPSPPAILMPNGDLVKPHICDAERLQGFPADWTLPAESVCRKGHRWWLVGNAVTVNVAEWIGQRLVAPRAYDGSHDAPLPQKGWPRAAWCLDKKKRFAANVSAWPCHSERTPLTKFLQSAAAPLSIKATAGFLRRTRSSTLRFPKGFLDKVARHLKRMEGGGSIFETRHDHADVSRSVGRG